MRLQRLRFTIGGMMVVVAILAIAILAFEKANRASVLRLSADPPAGGWFDPAEGARSKEMQCRAGEVLSRRPARGPLRCRLHAVPGAAAAGEPELEVVVDNPSDAAITLRSSERLLDYVTFVFRGPAGEVVSSFCYADIHSEIRMLDQEPASIAFEPGHSRTKTVYLSVAADHGFRPLPPGRYSIEAVLEGRSVGGRENRARSNRLPVVVGDAEKGDGGN